MKFNAIDGRGIVVHPQYIGDCNTQRQRLPLKGYLLSESNEEGEEEEEEDHWQIRAFGSAVRVHADPPLQSLHALLSSNVLDSHSADALPLADFFHGLVFYLDPSIAPDQKRLLTRYVIAYDGEVEQFLTRDVTHVCTSDPQLQSEQVSPDWILACHVSQSLLPLMHHS